MRKKVGSVLLILIVLYGLAEVAYRIYQYNRLVSNYREYWFWSVESPLYVLDSHTGYRYKSDARLTARYFDENGNLLRANPIRVNNFGHVSAKDDSLDKPPAEFRIAILGDSFTACTTNATPWPDLLEGFLNKDENLKRLLSVERFKVINCGMDGTGLSQWSQVYDHDASRFKPDLLLVNFITGDISRKFIFRDSIKVPSATANYHVTITCSALPSTLENDECSFARVIAVDPRIFEDRSRTTQVKREVYRKTVTSLPWFSPHPEILALGGLFGLTPRLQIAGRRLNPYFDTPEQAVSTSIKALREILGRHSKMLILHHPTLEELLHPTRELPVMVRNLIAQGSGLNIETMLRFLPVSVDGTEIRKWYIPNDGHPSDYGCALYAQAMLERLQEYFRDSRHRPNS